MGQHPGVLEDYADVAEGLHALVAATGDPVWLSFAEQLVDVVVTHFARPSGGFFDTADDSLDSRLSVIKRPQDPTDNATPSGLSAAAGSLLSFAAYTGSSLHRDAASGALGVYDVLADQAPRFAGWGLAVAEALAAGPAEVAVVGPADDQATAVLHRAALLGTTPAPPSSPAIHATLPARRCRCCGTARWSRAGRLRTSVVSSSAPRRQPTRPGSRPRSAPGTMGKVA